MKLLDLQRRLPAHVAFPVRLAAEAREPWERAACLLYAAHRWLRLLAALRGGWGSPGARRGRITDLRAPVLEGDGGPLQAWVEAKAGDIAGPLEDLAVAAELFLSLDELCGRSADESDALADEILTGLERLAAPFAGVALASASPDRPGLLWLFEGPEGHATARWDGATAQPRTLALVDGEPVEAGVAAAGDPSFPLLPLPSDRVLLECRMGTLFDAGGRPAAALPLTPARALGRLVLWSEPGADLDTVAERLAAAGLQEAAGEVLVCSIASRAHPTATVIEAALAFLTERNLSGADVLRAWLPRALEGDEQRLREEGDWQGLSNVLLARQAAERGPAKVATLARLCELFQERLSDPDSAFLCRLSAVEEMPADESLLRALLDAPASEERRRETAGRLLEGATGESAAAIAGVAARLAEAAGDKDGAHRAWQRVLAARAEDLPAHRNALLAARALGDPDLELPLLARMRDLTRDRGERLEWTLQRARILADAARGQDAAAEWRRALALDPTCREAFTAVVEPLFAAGDLEAVREEIVPVLEGALDGAFRAALLRRWGLMLADAHRDAEAAAALSDAVALDPACRECLEALVPVLDRLQDWQRLLAALRRLSKLDPAGAAGHLRRMADIAGDRMDDPEAALGFLIEAAEADPADPEPARRIREMHERLGLWAEVSRDLEGLLGHADGAEAVDLLVRLADVYLKRLSLREKAKETLWRAATEAAGSRADSVARRLAELHREDGDRDRELKALEIAASQGGDDEDRADLLARMGKRALEKPADREAARRYLDRAVHLNPLHPFAVEQLAMLLSEQGEAEAAAAVAAPLARKAGETGDAAMERRLRLLMGAAATRYGDLPAAIDHYARAVALDPSDTRTEVLLGRLQAQVGRDAEAAELLGRVLATAAEELTPMDRIEVTLTAARCAVNLQEAARSLDLYDAALALKGGGDAELLREAAAAAEKAGDTRRLVGYLEPLVAAEGPGPGRFAARMRLGDLCRDVLDDAKGALKWYRLAAEDGVSPKAALTKALDAAVAGGDFAGAKGLLVQMVEREQDGLKKAQYHYASALLARDNLGDAELTRAHLWQAIELNPEFEDAVEALTSMLVAGDDVEALAQLYGLLSRHFKVTGQDAKLLGALRRLAGIYDTRLHNLPMAAETWGQVLEVAPHDFDAAVARADLLTRTPGREREALDAHRRVITLDPTHDASYRSVRELCMVTGDEDGAWCAAGALIALGKGTESERTTYESRRHPALKLRRDNLPPEGFRNWILDEAADPGLTRVLGLVYSPMSRLLPFKSPADMGLSDADLVPMNVNGPLQNMAAAASKILGVRLPRVYYAKGLVGFAKAAFNPPALVVGDDVMSAWRGKELRFALGRAAVAFTPGYELAGIVDAGTLRLVALAALRVAFPDYPLPDDAREVEEMATRLASMLTPDARAEIGSILGSFRKEKKALDMSAFLAGIDHTANRAGLFLANDIEVAARLLRDDTLYLSELEFGDRLIDLCAWAVSPRYAEVRRTMLLDAAPAGAPAAL